MDTADTDNPPSDTRACPECGASFPIGTGRRQHQQFCCDEHRTAFRARCGVRGKVLIPYALAWHTARSSSRGPMKATASFAFREMSEMLRDWAREDAAAGRPKLADYMAVILATGYRYGDRKRRQSPAQH